MSYVPAALKLLNYNYQARCNTNCDYVIRLICFVEKQIISAFAPFADPPVPPVRGWIRKATALYCMGFQRPRGRFERHVVDVVTRNIMQIPEELIWVGRPNGGQEAGMMMEDGGFMEALTQEGAEAEAEADVIQVICDELENFHVFYWIDE